MPVAPTINPSDYYSPFQLWLNDFLSGVGSFIEDYALPIVGGVVGGPVGVGVGAIAQDLLTADERNQQAQQLTEDLQGEIGEATEAIESLIAGRPTIRFGDTLIGPGRLVPYGREGKLEVQGATGPVIDLPTSTGAEAALSAYLGARPDITLPRLDFSGLIDTVTARGDEAISGLEKSKGEALSYLGTGRQRIGETIGRAVGGIDTDLSDVLTSRLEGAAATGATREDIQRQELARSAGSFGGLENLQRQQTLLGSREAQGRALEASGIVGQTRAEELAAQQAVASLLGLQAQLEQGLSTTEAGVTSQYGRDIASLFDTTTGRIAELGRGEQTGNVELAGRELVLGLQDAVTQAMLSGQINAEEFQRALTAISLADKDLATQLAGVTTGAGLNLNVANILAGAGLFDINDILTTSLLPLLTPNRFNPQYDQQGQYGFDVFGVGANFTA